MVIAGYFLHHVSASFPLLLTIRGPALLYIVKEDVGKDQDVRGCADKRGKQKKGRLVSNDPKQQFIDAGDGEKYKGHRRYPSEGEQGGCEQVLRCRLNRS